MLHWVDKFKEIVKLSNSYESIVSQYLAFCVQEERKEMKRFDNDKML